MIAYLSIGILAGSLIIIILIAFAFFILKHLKAKNYLNIRYDHYKVLCVQKTFEKQVKYHIEQMT